MQDEPTTETVFQHKPLVFNDHQWVQQGYAVRDICSPSTTDCHAGAIGIPNGKMLTKDKTGYNLIDEKPL